MEFDKTINSGSTQNAETQKPSNNGQTANKIITIEKNLVPTKQPLLEEVPLVHFGKKYHWANGYTWNSECVGIAYTLMAKNKSEETFVMSQCTRKVAPWYRYSSKYVPSICTDTVAYFPAFHNIKSSVKINKQVPVYCKGTFVCTIPCFTTPYGCSGCNRTKECSCPARLEVVPSTILGNALPVIEDYFYKLFEASRVMWKDNPNMKNLCEPHHVEEEEYLYTGSKVVATELPGDILNLINDDQEEEDDIAHEVTEEDTLNLGDRIDQTTREIQYNRDPYHDYDFHFDDNKARDAKAEMKENPFKFRNISTNQEEYYAQYKGAKRMVTDHPGLCIYYWPTLNVNERVKFYTDLEKDFSSTELVTFREKNRRFYNKCLIEREKTSPFDNVKKFFKKLVGPKKEKKIFFEDEPKGNRENGKEELPDLLPVDGSESKKEGKKDKEEESFLDGIGQVVVKKAVKKLIEYIKEKKEELKTYLIGFNPKDVTDSLSFGLLWEFIPELFLGALEYVKKYPKELGAAMAFGVCLFSTKRLYDHACMYYEEHGVNQQMPISTVFPVEGVLGVVANNPIAVIIGAIGLQGLWSRAMETKDAEKSDVLSMLGNITNGTTTFLAVIASFMSAINLAAFATTRNPGRKFTTSNTDLVSKLNKIPTFQPRQVVVEKHNEIPNLVVEERPLYQPRPPQFRESQPRRRIRARKEKIEQVQNERRPPVVVRRKNQEPVCEVCKRNFKPRVSSHKKCESCFKQQKSPSSEHKKVQTELHKGGKRRGRGRGRGPPKGSKWIDYNKIREIEELQEKEFEKQERDFIRELNEMSGPRDGKNRWIDLDEDQDMSYPIEWNGRQRKGSHLLESKVSKNVDIEKHAKIPVPSISGNVVKVGDEQGVVGYGYLVASKVVVYPSHYDHISIVFSGSKRIPCNLSTTIASNKCPEGLSIAYMDNPLPFKDIPLGVPPAEFAGLVVAPSFSQVSSAVLLPEKDLISYVADSNFGDCGQPVVNTANNTIVGFHIGVNPNARVAKIAYAVALGPEVLRSLKTAVESLGF